MRRALVVMGLVVAGCGASAGTAPQSTPQPTPEPDGQLSLSDVTMTSRVTVGDKVLVGFHATNGGPGAASVVMRIGGASGKAEFVSCQPRCVDQDEKMGTRYIDFPDLEDGAEEDYVLTFRTLESGRIDWPVASTGS